MPSKLSMAWMGHSAFRSRSVSLAAAPASGGSGIVSSNEAPSNNEMELTRSAPAGNRGPRSSSQRWANHV
jgi:hypothetical protein